MKRIALCVAIAVSGTSQAATSANDAEVRAVHSREFLQCSKDAPLDAESYDCYDDEIKRLSVQLGDTWRTTLAQQTTDATRTPLLEAERAWWRQRFDQCKMDAAEFGGSTAVIIRESCEADQLARRIVWLRHFHGSVAHRG